MIRRGLWWILVFAVGAYGWRLMFTFYAQILATGVSSIGVGLP
jgi:hypothetical protein